MLSYTGVFAKQELERLHGHHWQSIPTNQHVRTGSAVDCKQGLYLQTCMCGPGFAAGGGKKGVYDTEKLRIYVIDCKRHEAAFTCYV